MRMPRNLSLLLSPSFSILAIVRATGVEKLHFLDYWIAWNGMEALLWKASSGSRVRFSYSSLDYFSLNRIGQLLGPAIIVTGEK